MALSGLLYDAKHEDRRVEVTPDLVTGLSKSQLLWIDIEDADASATAALSEALQITPSMIRRVTDLSRPPYLDNYDSCFAFAVDAPDGGSARDRTAGVQLGFIVSAQWLVTLHNGPVRYLSDFRAQDKGETAIGSLSPASLAASLLDWHLTEYFAEVAQIEALVDTLDELILADGAQRQVLDRIVKIRARVSRLRGQLATQRPIFYGFSRPDFALNFDPDDHAAFARLADRFNRAIDEVERTRDVVVGSFELFTSMTTQQTNDLVKMLTFITAIIGFCAAVAGLLGMNFDLPLFKTGTRGFEVVTAFLVGFSVLSLAIAKWRRWI